MRKLLLLSIMLLGALLSPLSSKAQFIVVGQGCGASGLSAIANDGTPVVCRQNPALAGNPLVWTAVGGGGGSSVQGVPGPVFNVKDPKYGAVGNTQQVVGALTIGQGTGGCPATTPSAFCVDIPSSANSPVKQSDVGMVMYLNEPGGGLNRIQPTTILSVNAGTGAHAGEQMIVPTTPSFNGGLCGSNCTFVWGTDDTVALNAASAAAKGACTNSDSLNYLNPPCATLFFPPGGYMTSGGGTTNPAGQPGISNNGPTNFIGSAMDASKFFLRPDYTIGTLGNALGIFLFTTAGTGGAGAKIYDFSVTCSGFTFTTFASNPFITTNGTADVKNIRVSQCGNSGNGNGQTVFSHSGRTSLLIVQDPSGGNVSPLCGFGNSDQDVYFLVCSNGNATSCSNLNILNVAGGTSSDRLAFHGGFIDEGSAAATSANTCLVNSKDVSFVGTTLTSGALAGGSAINVDATSEMRCNSCTIAPFGANGGGGVTVQSGGKFRTSMSKFIAVTSPSFIWNCVNTVDCIDDGGNNYSTSGGATVFKAGTAVPYSSLSHSQANGFQSGTLAAGTVQSFAVDQPISVSSMTWTPSNAFACTAGSFPTFSISDGTTTLTTAATDTVTNGAVTHAFTQSAANVLNPTGAANTVIQMKVVTTGTCGTAPTNTNINAWWMVAAPGL